MPVDPAVAPGSFGESSSSRPLLLSMFIFVVSSKEEPTLPLIPPGISRPNSSQFMVLVAVLSAYEFLVLSSSSSR
jgi:hypothetical protein